MHGRSRTAVPDARPVNPPPHPHRAGARPSPSRDPPDLPGRQVSARARPITRPPRPLPSLPADASPAYTRPPTAGGGGGGGRTAETRRTAACARGVPRPPSSTRADLSRRGQRARFGSICAPERRRQRRSRASCFDFPRPKSPCGPRPPVPDHTRRPGPPSYPSRRLFGTLLRRVPRQRHAQEKSHLEFSLCPVSRPGPSRRHPRPRSESLARLAHSF